jgi:signal transduction histidine kinase/DNA-binding response OmpR family regulator
MNGAGPIALGEVRIDPERPMTPQWERVRDLVAAATLDPLAAARLALAVTAAVWRTGAVATASLTSHIDRHGTVVTAWVRTTAAATDPPAGLVDASDHRPTVDGGSELVLTVSGTAHERSGDTLLGTATVSTDPWELFATLLTAASRREAGTADALANGADLEVEALRLELDETTRGMLALHAELCQRQEELELAREAAEQATRAKAAFLANMSHEIRSPMNAVVGFTSLLLDTALSPEQTEYAQAVQAAGSHLLGVIDDILDLSKVESGRLELEEIPFDLYACVEDAVAILAPKAAGKQLPLAALFGPDVPRTITGDPLRVRQILVNLLANAVKFTSTGQVSVEVERVGDADLELRVRDTGIGIRPEDLERLFAPFTQAEAGTTRAHGGTGLGLSISRQLAEQMGGSVTVRSAVGVGSTFSCLIPGRLAGQPPPDPVLAGARVLVIHDQALVAESVRRLLAGWGAAVMTAGSAAAAAALAGWSDAGLAIVGAAPADVDAEVATLTAVLDRPVPILHAIPITARRAGSAYPSVSVPIRRDRLRAAVLDALGRPDLVPAAPQPETARVSSAALADDLAQVLAAVPNRPIPTWRLAAPRSVPAAPPVPAGRDVLYVDDDQMTTDLVRRILAGQPDLTLRIAADGATALSLAAERRPDLVLLDLNLPDMGGDAVLRELRADPGTSTIPVVILSGDASPTTRARLADLGASGYLAKPFQPAQLRDLVSEDP